MMLKNKGHKFFITIIPVILIIAFIAINISVVISSPDPTLTITATTNQTSYLLRQKVKVNGTITLDGSPASDLTVLMQINNPMGNPMVCRTIQIGTPTQTWPINITDLFVTDASNNRINTLKTNTRGEVKFGMTIYNWQSTAREAYAIFTIFDANIVPLATQTWSGTLDPQKSVTPKYPIDIPAWACSGKALLVGNVYTKEPKTGGIALSLEKTTYICISRLQQGQFEYLPLPPPPPQTTPGIYATQIGLPPDPAVGNYQVYVLGQSSPIIISSTFTTFNVLNSAGYPPQASFAFWPAAPYLNMTVNLDASSSTPEGFNDNITKYEWNFGDGTPKIAQTESTITHAYQQTGTFIITLNVTDSESLWSTTTKPITILPEFGPTANFTWTPTIVVVNETVTFDASSSTEGWCANTQRYSPIVSYAWNYSDGTTNTTTAKTITHKFTQPGNYTVKLNITDADGRTGSISKMLEVQNVTLKMADINKDGKIDMIDLWLVAKAFGSYPGYPNWNPDADVNKDGKVDMIDLWIVAKNFGKDP